MKKALVLTSLLSLMEASSASAAGMNLAWDNCAGGGGAHSRAFACNTNSGSNTLVASIHAPAGIDLWTAFEAQLLFQFVGTQPAWWQLRNQTGQTAQCRNGALFVDAIGAGLSGCTDVYAGNGVGGIATYENAPFGFTNRARLVLALAVPPGYEVPLTPDEEYFVAKVVISNIKSTGSGACAGCQEPVCIQLMDVNVVQPAGAPGGDIHMNQISDPAKALWQATSEEGCIDVPAQRSTWGGVKALYR